LRVKRKLLIGVLAASLAATPIVVGVANAGTSETAVAPSDDTGTEDDPAVVLDPDDAVVDPNAPPAPVTAGPEPDAERKALTAEVMKQNGVKKTSCPTAVTEEVVRCVQVRRGDPKDRTPRSSYATPSSGKGISEEVEQELTTNTFSREEYQAQDIPAWCHDLNNQLGAWYITRTDACQYDEYWIDVVEVIDGVHVVVGTEKVLQTNWVTPSLRSASARYDHNVEIFILEQVGKAKTGSQQLKVKPICYNCKSHDIDPWYTFGISPRTFYISRYRNVVPLEIGEKKTSMSWQFLSYEFPGYLPLAELKPDTPDIRCDRIIMKTPGCIMEEGDGWFTVNIRRAKSREWASHVLDAERGLSDHWGWQGHGKVLTRNTSKKVRDKNNRVACTNPVPPGKEPGKSCDEYPFASTHEGAGVVGRNRTSSRYINEKHNSSGGGLTAAFYQRERILEADRFWVHVYAATV
jgi:hypothetical protein